MAAIEQGAPVVTVDYEQTSRGGLMSRTERRVCLWKEPRSSARTNLWTLAN